MQGLVAVLQRDDRAPLCGVVNEMTERQRGFKLGEWRDWHDGGGDKEKAVCGVPVLRFPCQSGRASHPARFPHVRVAGDGEFSDVSPRDFPVRSPASGPLHEIVSAALRQQK